MIGGLHQVSSLIVLKQIGTHWLTMTLEWLGFLHWIRINSGPCAGETRVGRLIKGGALICFFLWDVDAPTASILGGFGDICPRLVILIHRLDFYFWILAFHFLLLFLTICIPLVLNFFGGWLQVFWHWVLLLFSYRYWTWLTPRERLHLASSSPLL